MKIRKNTHDDKIELQMTPMIDIVFQLLVFFIMTFKIVLPEGDFNIRMPPPAESSNEMPPDTPTLTLRMTADETGKLNGLKLGDLSFDTFQQLRAHVRKLVNDEAGPGTASDREIELQCDFDLHYEYAINAITAISGYIENGQQFKLIENIRFSEPVE
ncbi:ExbD/TolR family protein [Aeoliella mucimassa]|uniref:Biopolymer transport protein ExbD/TolR n=1 Tax=Aeoliella mucimassa TaxID=2527972 RepID=A0A518AKP7_9BACT|nr:biopolymer transporter ExbD [Aeoliella mucimassa]QDU55300.1 Biopolymer transport protein ExbD/TolR [Aeoliella mucimassa]